MPISPGRRLQEGEAQIGSAQPGGPSDPRQRAVMGRGQHRKRRTDGEQELPSQWIEEPVSAVYPVRQVEIGIKIGGQPKCGGQAERQPRIEPQADIDERKEGEQYEIKRQNVEIARYRLQGEAAYDAGERRIENRCNQSGFQVVVCRPYQDHNERRQEQADLEEVEASTAQNDPAQSA